MSHRVAICLIVLSALCGAGEASAAQPIGTSSVKVRVDCSAHRGALAGSYRAATLRSVYRAMESGAAQFQDCGQAVASRLAGSVVPTRGSTADICAIAFSMEVA